MIETRKRLKLTYNVLFSHIHVSGKFVLGRAWALSFTEPSGPPDPNINQFLQVFCKLNFMKNVACLRGVLQTCLTSKMKCFAKANGCQPLPNFAKSSFLDVLEGSECFLISTEAVAHGLFLLMLQPYRPTLLLKNTLHPNHKCKSNVHKTFKRHPERLLNVLCTFNRILCLSCVTNATMSPSGIYLLKVNNRNTRKRCEICSKLTIKIPERRQWRRSGIFIVNFEHILHLALVFLLLTSNM